MLFKVHKQHTQTINMKKQTVFSLFHFEIETFLSLQTFGKASYLTGTHFDVLTVYRYLHVLSVKGGIAFPLAKPL